MKAIEVYHYLNNYPRTMHDLCKHAEKELKTKESVKVENEAWTCHAHVLCQIRAMHATGDGYAMTRPELEMLKANVRKAKALNTEVYREPQKPTKEERHILRRHAKKLGELATLLETRNLITTYAGTPPTWIGVLITNGYVSLQFINDYAEYAIERKYPDEKLLTELAADAKRA